MGPRRSGQTFLSRIPLFDLELLAKLLDHLPIYIFPIVGNELSWYAVAANDVVSRIKPPQLG